MGVTLVARRVRSGDAARWVEEIRSSVFTALPSEQHPAFLLATPEAFFFWRAGPSELERESLGDLATYEWMTEADPILKPYFARAGVRPGGSVAAGIFENIVWWWLGDVVSGIAPRNAHLEGQGFYDVVRGGRVELRAAA